MMRCFVALLSRALFVLVLAEAASTTTIAPPECGLRCIVNVVVESSCSLTNTTCICTNQQVADSITSCLEANCVVRDQLSTEKYSKEACGAPLTDRRKLVSVTCLVGSAMANLAFVVRIAARFMSGGGNLGLDDLCLTATMLLNVPFTVFSVILADRGLGRDLWEVTFDNITYILYIYYWDELIYTIALPLIKISILFFYRRIFPDNRFRQITWILIALNSAYSITYFLITLFQCQPIDGAWKRWDGTFQGKCNNASMQAWTSAGFNIVLDVVMLCLPLPPLYRLNLSPKKKFQILLMFGVGFFITLVSVIRLQSLVKWANSTNITQDFVAIGYWSTIEVHVGIICACMPAMRGLFRRLFLGVTETQAASSAQYQQNYFSAGRMPSASSQNVQKSLRQDDGSSSVHELIEVGVAK